MIDLRRADPHIRRYAEAAQENGYLDEPEHETMRCACGHSGPPLAIIRYSQWHEADDIDRDMFICPGCGDA